MEKNGKVGFLGSFQADFITYCARTLSAMGRKVLVVDESRDEEIAQVAFSENEPSHLLRHLKAKEETTPLLVSYFGVDYIRGMHLEQVFPGVPEYEFILYYFGQKADFMQLKGMDEVFALSFCDAVGLSHLREFMKEAKVPMHVILRNVCGSSKERKSYFYYLEKENAFIAERFFLPFDEIDETYRIRMQYRQVDNFKDISNAMGEIIRKVLFLLCPGEDELVRRGLKKARQGGRL